MAVQVTIGPSLITINHGSTFLVSEFDGSITDASDQGLYSRDTRYISRYQIYIDGLAAKLRQEAADLQQRFEEQFWCEELDYYAYALDGEKKQVKTIASNAGHLLWSGIVRPDRATSGAATARTGHVERLGHTDALRAASRL